jgi:hypothetical protein
MEILFHVWLTQPAAECVLDEYTVNNGKSLAYYLKFIDQCIVEENRKNKFC